MLWRYDRSGHRQAYRRRKWHQLKAEKGAMMVGFFYDRAPHILTVNGIYMVAAGMHRILRRDAEKQQGS